MIDSYNLLSSITGKWKFVDGPSPVNGRVEAWDDGIWGSVCNSSFDDVDASILCRSFNFRQVLNVYNVHFIKPTYSF